MISYDDFLGKIKGVAQTISPGGLFYPIHQPEVTARFGHCFNNVLEKMDKDGGNLCCGWTFGHRFNPQYGEYMVLTHHAVWHFNGKLVDVTPFSKNPGLYPAMKDDCIIFLVDAKAMPVMLENLVAPLPNMYFPLGDSPELKAYVEQVNKQEVDECQKLYDGKYTSDQISGFLERKP